MNEVNIFDIQRCSMVDGPGLRTTVFFKGCNLRCKWCHNPESQSFERQLMFHKNRCKGCGKCKEVCPFHLEKCILCGKCVDYCAHGAREIVGKILTPAEILKEVLKDKPFYETSGGGVTFSGGECMLQIDALVECARLCKEAGVQVAIDTAGNVPWASFEKILPYADYFLYDVKAWSEDVHKENTGASNKLLLENLGRLADIDPDKIIIRIPVIVGVNACEEELLPISEFFKAHGITKLELLPYHKMGEHKYEDLNRELVKFEVPSEDAMARFRAIFK